MLVDIVDYQNVENIIDAVHVMCLPRHDDIIYLTKHAKSYQVMFVEHIFNEHKEQSIIMYVKTVMYYN